MRIKISLHLNDLALSFASKQRFGQLGVGLLRWGTPLCFSRSYTRTETQARFIKVHQRHNLLLLPPPGPVVHLTVIPALLHCLDNVAIAARQGGGGGCLGGQQYY